MAKTNKESLFVFVCIVGALTAFVSTLYFISLCYHAGPYRDMWIAMDFIRGYFEGNEHFSDFFSLHGGAHRLAVPRLLFLIEYGLFSGSNVFLIASSVAIQLSVVCLVWKILQQESHISGNYRWFLMAVSSALMFNATQLENFVYTFDMQWFATSSSAAWALYFWSQLFKALTEQNKFSKITFAFASLTTAISALSSFSGLCILLALPFLMVTYRLSAKLLVISTLFIVFVIAAYMSGPFYHGGEWGSADSATVSVSQYFWYFRHVFLLWVKWVALYFGSPLGREFLWLGAIFAYSSLLLVAWQWCKLIYKGISDYSPFQIITLSIALFAAIVGISTGLGRMYFVNTADEDRYQSIALIYWLAVFLFSMSRAIQIEIDRKNAYYKYLSIAVIVFWTAIVIPVFSIKDAKTQINFFNRVKNVDLAIATGQWDYSEIKDTLILGDKWKKINRPEEYAAFLHDKKWGVFATREYALLNTSIDSQSISADSCEGEVDAIVPIGKPYRGYRIAGHGLNVMNESLLKNYIAIDETGLVVGLGRLQREKDSLLPQTWQPRDDAHWLLYTENLVGVVNLRILGALSNDEGYCVMASAKLPSPDA